MIDFNWPEIVTLGVLAMVFFGPEKLPEFARKAARVIAYLSKIGNDARGQLRAELGPEFDDIRLSDLNPKNLVARHLLSAEDKEDLLAIRDEFRSAGQLVNDGVNDVTSSNEPAREDELVSVEAGTTRRATPFDPEAT